MHANPSRPLVAFVARANRKFVWVSAIRLSVYKLVHVLSVIKELGDILMGAPADSNNDQLI